MINRNDARLWVGQSISSLGDTVFDTTLVLWIATIIAHNQPWAPLAVSGVLVAAGLPIFLVGPLAGVFVDRWNKRLTMLRMDALRAVFIALLLLAALPLPFLPGGQLPSFVQLGLMYLMVFLASACSQFFFKNGNHSLMSFASRVAWKRCCIRGSNRTVLLLRREAKRKPAG